MMIVNVKHVICTIVLSVYFNTNTVDGAEIHIRECIDHSTDKYGVFFRNPHSTEKCTYTIRPKLGDHLPSQTRRKLVVIDELTERLSISTIGKIVVRTMTRENVKRVVMKVDFLPDYVPTLFQQYTKVDGVTEYCYFYLNLTLTTCPIAATDDSTYQVYESGNFSMRDIGSNGMADDDPLCRRGLLYLSTCYRQYKSHEGKMSYEDAKQLCTDNEMLMGSYDSNVAAFLMESQFITIRYRVNPSVTKVNNVFLSQRTNHNRFNNNMNYELGLASHPCTILDGLSHRLIRIPCDEAMSRYVTCRKQVVYSTDHIDPIYDPLAPAPDDQTIENRIETSYKQLDRNTDQNTDTANNRNADDDTADDNRNGITDTTDTTDTTTTTTTTTTDTATDRNDEQNGEWVLSNTSCDGCHIFRNKQTVLIVPDDNTETSGSDNSSTAEQDDDGVDDGNSSHLPIYLSAFGTVLILGSILLVLMCFCCTKKTGKYDPVSSADNALDGCLRMF